MTDPLEPDDLPGAAREGAPHDVPEEVPDGAAVFAEIPEELGINPLLLAVLHATVFLAGSDNEVVNPAAASEAMDWMAVYLRRLRPPLLDNIREDLMCLQAFGRREKWPKAYLHFLKNLLSDYGIGTEDEA